MNTKTIKTNIYYKAISTILVLLMTLMLLLPMIGTTLAEPTHGGDIAKIAYFDESDLVYRDWVEIGTSWEDLLLPAERRAAIFMEYSEASNARPLPGNTATITSLSQSSAVGATTIDREAGIIESNAEESVTEVRNTEESSTEESSTEISFEATPTQPTATPAAPHAPEAPETATAHAPATEENVKSTLINIPVSWEGHYNGEEPGEYILTAKIENYTYSGELPIAIITVDDPNALMQQPQRGPVRIADYTIDIGKGPGQGLPIPNAAYTGYTVADDKTGKGITLNKDANSYTYEITQTGASNAPYWTLYIPDGVDTRIILNGINTDFYIHMYGHSTLNLLLAGENTIKTGYFVVRENAKITIDSAESQNTGSTSGTLDMTVPNSSTAGIGGYFTSNTDRSDSGLITINGGTLKVTRNSTSNIESAVIGGAYGTHGHIVINGGNITATNNATSFGAAIGGGRNGTGNVVITGGTVTATVPIGGAGAAIGGGQGSGNTTTGTGNVTISGGHIIASSRNGAAIGGGERSSNAKVIITGGIIDATVSGTGAAIGGGGGATGSNVTVIDGTNLHVEISGGILNLKAPIGSGVGHGGYQGASTPNHSEKLAGVVKITGGQIVADVYEGTGIGTGLDNKIVPQLTVDSSANILVFGRKRTAFAGIYAGDSVANHGFGRNYGNGYYVNINFPDTGAQMKAGTQFIIMQHGSLTNHVRTITAPYDIGMLSFTTGSQNPSDYNIYIQAAGGYKQLAHPSSPRPSPLPSVITYNDTRIYSVNETFAYLDNGHVHDSYFRSLPLKADIGGTLYHIVTERFVDRDGIILYPESMTFIVSSGTYGKTAPAVSGYTYKGHVWDTAPAGNNLIAGNPDGEVITKDRLVYFVYDLYVKIVPTGIASETWTMAAFMLAALLLIAGSVAAIDYIKRRL